MPHDFDAIVIGAGPAGSAAGRLLALRGWRVAIVESKPRGRDKACGRCLSPHAVALLGRWGLREAVLREALGETVRLQLAVDGRVVLDAPLGHARRTGAAARGVLVHRGRFDQALADEAERSGVTILRPASARLESVEEAGAWVRVQRPSGVERLRCGLVIGADGLGSSTARRAGLATDAGGRRFGFACEAPKGIDVPASTIRMHAAREGYVGVVRCSDAVHCAGLVRAEGLSPEEMLRRILPDTGAIDRRRCTDARATVLGAGPMPWRPRRIASHRVALVGDAAGYVEPFSGEGMHWALASAEELAVTAGEQPVGEWSDAAAGDYARQWSRRLGPAHAACRRLSMLVRSPRLVSAAGWIASSLPVMNAAAFRHFAPA